MVTRITKYVCGDLNHAWDWHTLYREVLLRMSSIHKLFQTNPRFLCIQGPRTGSGHDFRVEWQVPQVPCLSFPRTCACIGIRGLHSKTMADRALDSRTSYRGLCPAAVSGVLEWWRVARTTNSEAWTKWLTFYGRHFPWWRHQMETFSALLAICHTKASDGELWCFLWSAPE